MTDNNNNMDITMANYEGDGEEIQRQKNEILFWKVIHKKHIFNIIFNQIRSVEWVKELSFYKIDKPNENNTTGDYTIGNRKKFKYITSLDFMVKHELFSLLRCKLERGDQVDIDYGGIKSLILKKSEYGIEFKDNEERDDYIVGKLKEIGYYRTGDEKMILQRNEIQLSNKETLSNNIKESLELLIKKKRSRLIILDTLSIVLLNWGEVDNIEIVKLLINEPYSFPITEEVIENAIKYATLPVIEILFNSPKIKQSNNINNKSVLWSIGNSASFKLSERVINHSIAWSLQNSTTDKLNIIKLLINAPYSFPIPSNTMEYAIKYETLSIIETLFNSPTFQTKNYLMNNSVSWSVDNCSEDRLEIIKFILDNNLFNGSTCTKIKQVQAYSIHSSDLIERLYKLNLIQCDSIFTPFDFKDIFKSCSSNIMVYSQYLQVYDEIIDQPTNKHIIKTIYDYAVRSQSVEALKYLFKKSQHEQLNIYSISSFSNKEFSNEFIKHYSYISECFRDQTTRDGIIDYIHSIKSKCQYSDVYNSISNSSSLKVRLSSKWFDINKLGLVYTTYTPDTPIIDKQTNPPSNNNQDIILQNETIRKPNIIITDTGTIDLIIENYNYIECYFKYGFNLYFSSCKLVVFLRNKLHIDNALKVKVEDPEIYHYIFTLAIYNCNIDELKYLNQQHSTTQMYHFKEIDPVYSNSGDKKQWKFPEKYIARGTIEGHMVPFNFNNQSQSNYTALYQMVKYLNATNYIGFTDTLFVEFIKCICSTPSIDFAKLIINFKRFENAKKYLFKNSIQETISPNIIQLILNNCDQMFLELKDYNFKYCKDSTLYISNSGDIFQNKSSDTFFYNGELIRSNDSIQDTQLLITMLFDQLYKTYTIISGNRQSIRIISKLFNGLFKRLIKIRNISLEQVDSTYQLISSKWKSITGKSFEFQHSQYHMFYYLGIKSLKLVNILKSDTFSKSLDQCEELNYNFIFNSSFQTVLEKLINEFYSISTENDGKREAGLNNLLIHCLEIKEFDQFFKIIENIKRDGHSFKFIKKLISSATIVLNENQIEELNQQTNNSIFKKE